MSLRFVGLLAFLGVIFVLSAATVPIGILTTMGYARMDNSEIRGSGTVLNGSVVETANDSCEVNLKTGTRLELAPNSRARIYEDRVVLERGSSQMHSSGTYAAGAFPVLVNSLQVLASSSSTVGMVRSGPRTLQVSAVTGGAEVRNGRGFLIARLPPGSALDFQEPAGGAAAASQVSGKITKQNGHYLLTDSTTNTTVELQGENLEFIAGQCIAAMGSQDMTEAPDAGATQLIHVASYHRVPCGQTAAAAAGPAGARVPSAGAGMPAWAVGAIVSGVAVGATLGGLSAAGMFTGGSPRFVSAP